MFAIVWLLFVSTVIGPRARPVASAASLSRPIASADGRRVDVRRLDDDVGRQCRARERLLHAVVGLHHVERLGEGVRAGSRHPQLEGGGGERQQQSARDHGGEQRPAQDAIDDRSPDAALAVVAAQPADERNVQPVDAVAELREQRRENGQRADHCERDDDHRRVPEGGEGGVAGQEQAGHRHHHRQAGDEHRAAGGGSCGLERGALAPPGGPFLSFAPEVEHRVVDADREPDQQHDGERLGCKREQVTGQGRQPERREHGRERQQQRDARGHERAERDDEDDQRERDGEDACALEVVREGGVDRFGRARAAELADEEARMGALRVGDALQDRAELVHRLGAVAADLELDERGMPALRDLARVGRIERRADVLDGRAPSRGGPRRP